MKKIIVGLLFFAVLFAGCQMPNNASDSGNNNNSNENTQDLAAIAVYNKLVGTKWEVEVYEGTKKTGFPDVVIFADDSITMDNVQYSVNKDDFKFINDMYGHESGDRALQILAESMRKSFPEHAVLGRKGGDEFCIFLDDCTGEEVRKKLEQFTKKKRSFWYEGEKVTYTISLGYAEYPLQGKTIHS